jgi:hypothetical protein
MLKLGADICRLHFKDIEKESGGAVELHDSVSEVVMDMTFHNEREARYSCSHA